MAAEWRADKHEASGDEWLGSHKSGLAVDEQEDGGVSPGSVGKAELRRARHTRGKAASKVEAHGSGLGKAGQDETQTCG